VILPDLAREPGRGSGTSVPLHTAVGPDGTEILGMRVGRAQNSARVWYDLDHRRHEKAEEVRVLYVALTRAEDRLVLIDGPSRSKGSWQRALEPWGYDAKNPPADGALLADGKVVFRVCEPPARPRRSEPDAPEASARAADAYEAAVASLRAAARPLLAAPSALETKEAGPVTPGPGPARSRDTGQAVGEALHRLMEHWDGGAPDRLGERLDATCLAVARARGADAAAVAREAREVLDAFLASDLPERFSRIERLGHEVALLVHDDETDRSYRGSIDLLYRDETSAVVVADYKTDRETEPQALGRRYRPQLAVYAEAVRRALDLPALPRMELWLLRTGSVVPLSAADEAPMPPGDGE